MKKRTQGIFMLLFAAATIIIGCKKEKDIEPKNTTTTTTATTTTTNTATSVNESPSSVDKVLNLKRNAAAQSFSINTSAISNLTGADGTKIKFEANAFLTSSGAPVTGAVDIKVTEILNYREMLKLNVSTVGIDNGLRIDNGTPTILVSGGQINITATQNGDTLSIKAGAATVQVPTELSDNNMQLFYGDEDANGNVIWTAPDTTPVTTVSTNSLPPDSLCIAFFGVPCDSMPPGIFDTTGAGAGTIDYYEFPITSLGWINCDYFYRSNSTTDVDIELPTECDRTNTTVWCVFPSINSVMKIYGSYNSSPNIFEASNIGVGMAAKIIVLTKIGDQYQYGVKSITVQADAKETITLTSTTLEQFEAAIDNF